jgi:hypothetical protein
VRSAWLLLPAFASGCYVPPKKVVLRVELPAELGQSAKNLRVLPQIAETGRAVGSGIVALELKREAGKVRLELPGACPLLVDLRTLPTTGVSELVLKPLFDVGTSERVVGLGQSFELVASANCREAEKANAGFVVSGGAPLENVVVGRGGRRLRATTGAAGPAKSATRGIVPVSAREQERLRSEVTFRVRLSDGARFERVLGISAVARSGGLADVGFAHPVLLGGSAWSLLEQPPESKAALRHVGELFELLPDVPGQYRVSDARGTELALHSGRYDQMPLDCGRSSCHAEIAESLKNSPMTQVLASDLGGCHSLTNPACASACHATGEPGTADGGFDHVASELAIPALPAEHDDLPRALRRLGAVGCMACHGPTKIPEPQARSTMLRNDVCAVCHDAPPRYGHVEALEASRMGHADSSPAVRGDLACARCHTAWGALGRAAPTADALATGITCPVCHDVHPHGKDPSAAATAMAAAPVAAPTGGGLLRALAMPATLPAPPPSFYGVSRVCVSCHAPTSDTLRPEASAAAIVAGQGGLEPETGAALSLAGPHSSDAKGCLTCHDSGPEQLVLGRSHGFRATDKGCGHCHGSAKSRDPSLAERALRLLARLDPARSLGSAERPWHASYQLLPPTPQQTRALRDVLLVLEDPAADVHHPRYAKALLDAAERLAPGTSP